MSHAYPNTMGGCKGHNCAYYLNCIKMHERKELNCRYKVYGTFCFRQGRPEKPDWSKQEGSNGFSRLIEAQERIDVMEFIQDAVSDELHTVDVILSQRNGDSDGKITLQDYREWLIGVDWRTKNDQQIKNNPMLAIANLMDDVSGTIEMEAFGEVSDLMKVRAKGIVFLASLNIRFMRDFTSHEIKQEAV